MSRRVNPTVLGAFVLGAVGLAVAAVLVFGGGAFFTERYRMVLFFEGSVQGLNVGAPVVLRGVQVGQVTDVMIRVEEADLTVQIPVFIEIAADRLVRAGGQGPPITSLGRWIDKGLRGQLKLQSLVTGQLLVDLDFHPDKPARFVGVDLGVPELPTVPTPLQRLLETVEELPLREIVQRVAGSLEGIERVVNSPQASESVQALQGALVDLRALVQELKGRVGPVLEHADGTLADARRLVRSLDGTVRSLADEAHGTLADTRALVRRADDRLGPLMDRAEATLGDTQTLVGDVSDRVGPTLSSVQTAANDADRVLRRIEEEVDPLARQVRDAAGAASRAFARADALFAAAEAAVGPDSRLGYDLSNALRELEAAARSLRALSQLLEQRPDALLRGRRPPGAP